MNHTPQIKKAIQFAARKHDGHFRVGAEPLPYITHLFSVALLVAEDGTSDDVVTAALLHDTLEDTATERVEIVEAFNERVAKLVEEVSEDKTLPWKERKTKYLEGLKTGTLEALMIALGDKIDNIESKLEAYKKEGEAFLKNWKQPVSEYLWYHGEALRIGQARLPEHRLTKRLTEAHQKEVAVFTKP